VRTNTDCSLRLFTISNMNIGLNRPLEGEARWWRDSECEL